MTTTTTSTPTRPSAAAELIRDLVSTGDRLTDRAGLARFLRDHRLVTEGAIPITLADLDEAIALRDGILAVLDRDSEPDPEVIARGQKVLDGLRVTIRLEPARDTGIQLAPAVVDEVRRGLARIAGAWAVVLATGEWRDLHG